MPYLVRTDFFEPEYLDSLVKSHHIDGKVKSSYARRANLEE